MIRLLYAGEAISPQGNKLVFISTTRLAEKKIRTQTFRIKGKWVLTKSNELHFRTSLTGKIIKFQGSWLINKNQELVYKWEGKKLKSGRIVQFNQLIFKGQFEFNSKLKLRYKITGSGEVFEFDGKIVGLKDVKGRGAIRFELGARYKHRVANPKQAILTLYGSWRPISKTQIGFRVKLRAGKYYEVALKGSYFLTTKNSIEFRLKQEFAARKLVLSTSFIRKLPIGEVFLRGETDFKKSHFIGLGARLLW